MKKILILFLSIVAFACFSQVYVPVYELLTASGTDTYSVTKTPTPSITNGLKFEVKFTNANTGASTLNVNTLGAITLRKSDGTALSAGDIPAGSVWWVTYDHVAVQFKLVGGGGSTDLQGAYDNGDGTITVAALKPLLFQSATDANRSVYFDDDGNFTVQSNNAASLIENRVGTISDTYTLMSKTAYVIASSGNVSIKGKTMSTIGGNYFSLTNPSAITFPRQNADNTISSLSASSFRTAIGAGTGDGTVTSVSGTSNRVSSTGGTTPVIDIDVAYVGQTSIVTTGTLTTGATGSGFTLALGTSTLTGDLPFTNLTQIAGLSVLGVTGASTADVAAITAGADYNVLRRASSSSLGFGSIDLSQSGAVGSSILGIANGGTGASTLPTLYGSIYSASSFSSLTGFTDNTSGGASVSGGAINFTGGTNVLTNTLDYDYQTALEYWKMEAKFTTGTKTGTSYGFGLGINSTNTYGQCEIFVYFDMTTGANSGKILIKSHSDATGATSSSAVSFTATDQVTLTLERRENRIYATAVNTTTAGNPVTVEYTYINYPNSAGIGAQHNTGKFCILNRGGSFSLNTLSINSSETKNAVLCIVGDSKAVGYDVTAQENRFGTLLKNDFHYVVVNSGGNDRTTEVLLRIPELTALNPKYVLLCIGSNDVRSGVASATYTANYASITSQLQSAGITVIHLLPFRETGGVNVTTLKNYITTNYASSYIDTYNLASSMLDASIHPNDEGNFWIYNMITNSTLLPARPKGNRIAIPNRFSVHNTLGASQIRFGTNSVSNDGGFLTSVAADNLNVGTAEFNGTNWIAKSTGASIISMGAGSMTFYGNTGTSAGSSITPTARFSVSASTGLANFAGGVQIQGSMSAANNGDALEEQVISSQAYITALSRPSITYLPLNIRASTISLAPSATEVLAISAATITVANAANFVFNTSTGTKLGTSTSQKIGAFNATPIVQPGATTDLGVVLSNLGWRASGTAYPITTSGAVTLTGRSSLNQGADVASVAGAIAVGTDGNAFEITGTNAITLISNTSWQNGAIITLVFTSTATLTDGTANSGTDIGMELEGNANFSATADDTVILMLSEIGGVQRWRQIGGKVN